jgi:adenylate cyclase
MPFEDLECMAGYTIGIVDDDRSIRELLKTFLEKENYRVVTAGTCDEALTLARQSRFDAFLMDIEIGRDSGIELCRNIRSIEAHQHTPIICITGQDYPQILLNAFNAGADDFIGKPINLVSLLARLKLQLQKTDYALKLERARHMLRRYLSPRVANLAEEYSETGKVPPPEERQVSICFTDIRGFTALSETMDPSQLFASLSGHLRRQVELVYRYGGYVDKFNGDGIMAVFDGNDMVEKCCLCALSIMEDASRSNPGEEKFPIGIGIHTGRVIVGNIGSPEHLDYSVIGATVNLAARLCGYAQPENIIVSGSVRDAIGPNTDLAFVESREVQMRGVSGAVQIFRLDIERARARGVGLAGESSTFVS